MLLLWLFCVFQFIAYRVIRIDAVRINGSRSCRGCRTTYRTACNSNLVSSFSYTIFLIRSLLLEMSGMQKSVYKAIAMLFVPIKCITIVDLWWKVEEINFRILRTLTRSVCMSGCLFWLHFIVMIIIVIIEWRLLSYADEFKMLMMCFVHFWNERKSHSHFLFVATPLLLLTNW